MLSNFRGVSLAALGAAAILAADSLASAANITFAAPTHIAGSSDVLATGTTVGAIDVGGSGGTANGVVFTGYTGTPGAISNGQTISLNMDNGPYSAGSGNTGSTDDYDKILSTLDYNNGNTTTTVTLSGLTIGDNYAVQLFAEQTTAVNNNGLVIVASTTPGNTVNSVNLDASDVKTAGPPTVYYGQYTIGTFTADALTQTFQFNGVGHPNAVLNAIQLRDVTNTPEPAALGLLALGATTSLVRRRR